MTRLIRNIFISVFLTIGLFAAILSSDKPKNVYMVETISSPVHGTNDVIDGLRLEIYNDRIFVGTQEKDWEINKQFKIDSVEDATYQGFDVNFYHVTQTEGGPLRDRSNNFVIGIEQEGADFCVFTQGREILFILMFEKDENDRGKENGRGEEQVGEKFTENFLEGSPFGRLIREKTMRSESEYEFIRQLDGSTEVDAQRGKQRLQQYVLLISGRLR